MKFSALLVGIVSTLVFRSVNAGSLDVWTPSITFPTQGAVLQFQQTYNFTWDASNPPAQITNQVAAIYLRQNGRNLPIILAGNIPITQGFAYVTIPWVTSGTYQSVLFGDSGDFSPEFTITSPDPSASYSS